MIKFIAPVVDRLSAVKVLFDIVDTSLAAVAPVKVKNVNGRDEVELNEIPRISLFWMLCKVAPPSPDIFIASTVVALVFANGKLTQFRVDVPRKLLFIIADEVTDPVEVIPVKAPPAVVPH